MELIASFDRSYLLVFVKFSSPSHNFTSIGLSYWYLTCAKDRIALMGIV